MSCWALVPIKARAECKGRLAGWLAPAERLSIVREMASRVLAAVVGARSIDHVAVVTPERDRVPMDVLVLDDRGRGLNSALDFGRHELLARDADELVVLPADLPITAADIDLLVARGRRTGFALATDTSCTGTNALFLRPADAFRFQFGPDSRRHHLAEAARLGWTVEAVRTRGLEFDLDRVEDLIHLSAQGDACVASMQLFPAGGAWLPQTRFG
jgi:2-phospho-L-lactate guanylyltransferase